MPRGLGRQRSLHQCSTDGPGAPGPQLCRAGHRAHHQLSVASTRLDELIEQDGNRLSEPSSLSGAGGGCIPVVARALLAGSKGEAQTPAQIPHRATRDP